MNYATSALSSRRAFPGETLTPCTYQMIPASRCGFASWRENASEAVQATVEIAASAVGMPLKDLPLCGTETPATLVTTPGSHGDNEITCCCKHAFIIRGVYRHLHVPAVYTEDFAFISSAHPQGMAEAELRPGVSKEYPPFQEKSLMESSTGLLLGTFVLEVILLQVTGLRHKLGLK